MDAAGFVTIVERVAGLHGAEAEPAVRATLTTLAERLSPAEARDLTEALPPELGPWLFTTDPAEGFDVDEFLRRVAARAELDLATAERVARAVFLALAQALSADEFADVQAQLPKDFASLLPRGPAVEVLPLEELLDRVADRAGRDLDGARRATEAVLDRVAEREGVTREQAFTDARAVFTTLRKAVGDQEFFDTTVQLPPDYAVLWVR